ncbi:MAG: hypothetical protein IPN69_10660 [Acidobacteria bacterium]|nr:hypothetical protein [Acidobacteriota bacterium]
MRSINFLATAAILSFSFFGSLSCSSPAANNQANSPANSAAPAANNKATDNSSSTTAKSNVTESKPAAADKSACLTAKMDGKKLIASQTFVFDNEPFKGSCFVTFANREDMVDEKDVPRGSTFHIFKDGKKVFDFPDAFAGTQACWVEAVGFEDLNDDKKTDVIIAGSCLSARDSYPQNAVYSNEGNGFTTRDESNELLNEFKTVKAIGDFVKKNAGKFF